MLGHSESTLQLLKLLHCISSKIKISQCYSISLARSIKYITLYLSLHYFLLAASVFFVLFCEPNEYRCGVVIVVTFMCRISMYVPTQLL
jgi:hypothetical protein